jgi:hypothetical protein
MAGHPARHGHLELFEVPIIEKLKRNSYFAKRMAKTVDSEERLEEA